MRECCVGSHGWSWLRNGRVVVMYLRAYSDRRDGRDKEDWRACMVFRRYSFWYQLQG